MPREIFPSTRPRRGAPKGPQEAKGRHPRSSGPLPLPPDQPTTPPPRTNPRTSQLSNAAAGCHSSMTANAVVDQWQRAPLPSVPKSACGDFLKSLPLYFEKYPGGDFTNCPQKLDQSGQFFTVSPVANHQLGVGGSGVAIKSTLGTPFGPILYCV